MCKIMNQYGQAQFFFIEARWRFERGSVRSIGFARRIAAFAISLMHWLTSIDRPLCL